MKCKSSLKNTNQMLLMVAMVFGPNVASANGYLFFRHNNEAQGQRVGTFYTGAVTDQQGRIMPDVEVSINAVKSNISIVLFTGKQGRYKSAPLVNTINPKDVNLSVAKRGYKVLKVVRMSPATKPGQPIEINFVLSKL